jgi:hypothetical protein
MSNKTTLQISIAIAYFISVIGTLMSMFTTGVSLITGLLVFINVTLIAAAIVVHFDHECKI